MSKFFGIIEESQWRKSKDIKLSFEGEIYNLEELKQELASEYKFEKQNNEQVIVSAYLKWGVNFVQHLRGIFAIALRDGDTLFLFRDRFGKKPLYFMQDEKFIFASEIKALIPFLKRVKMNEDALMSYLSFLAPTAPYTFFQGINKLAPAEYLVLKNNSYEVKKYFDFLDAKPNIITDKDEAIYILERLLKESIAMHTDANKPMASLLSGGIDSASINFYAKQEGLNLQTYTLGYKNFTKYDERADAKETADFLGIDNIDVEISQNDFIDASDKVLDALDEPLNDPASIPLYLLFDKIKRDGYKVVLSGDGGDELFLGYRQYFEFLDIEQISKLSNKNWLKKYFRSNFSQNREWEYYKRIFDDTLLFRTSGESFTDLQKNALMKRNVKDNQALKYLKNYRDKFELSMHSDESIWYSYIDLNHFQAEHFLKKLDAIGTAQGIESRTPFLDNKLASTIFSIDASLRYEDGVTKSLLKRIMKPHLNEKILKRKKKGFSNPYMEYLIDSKKIDLIKDVNSQTGMFKTKELNELIGGASSGGFKQHIWGLYVLSVWLKKWIL